MSEFNAKEFIAKRVAKELKDGNIVNLGIGLPTMVANYVSDEITVHFQSENGMIGLGPVPADEADWDYDISNAGGKPVSIQPGGAYFDSTLSFSIIRGGHVDITCLGSLQVDSHGNIANWIIPGKMVPGMGGAMDLVTGAKRVIVAMTHTNKGKPKILKDCTLPLTAQNQVNMIVTEMGVMEIHEDGIHLVEYNPMYTIEEIKQATDAELIINQPKIMEV